MMNPSIDAALHQFLHQGIHELLDCLPAAIFVKDRYSRLIFMNQACEQQWGVAAAQLIGTDGSGFFPPEQMQLFLAKDREVFARGTQLEIVEAAWNAQLQQNRVVQTFKRPVFDASGEPLYVFGVSIDVTDRLQAEARRCASDEKLRRLFEMSPMGIALTDMQGRYIEFNTAFENICGYSADELRQLDFWTLTPREYFAQEQKQLESLQQHGAYGPYEKEYIRKDGGRVPLRLNGVRIIGDDGQPYVWSIVEDLSERRRKDELIWRQANFDRATGLPNRALFHDRLEQEIRQARLDGSRLALLLINLDHFKDINDSFGHEYGDQLLIETARRLRTCVDEAATIARVGGDEFAIIVTHAQAVEQVESIARAAIEQINTPYQLGEQQGFVSASVGISIYPHDAADRKALIVTVEHALQLARQKGRGRFAWLTETMQKQAELKRTLTHDLRQALARGELIVYYQPIVEARTGRICKAEALLRWQHPQRGLVGPMDFIPLAEESGLIVDIGEWVLRESLAATQYWSDQLGHNIEISVNMSPLQFAEGQASTGWLATLQQARQPAHRIALEITESLLLQDSESIKQRLLQLRTMGIEVSIDDFGTGFSALSYLKKFDIDYLKIDRAFTSGLLDDESDRALTEAIIVMAHKLGIATIAEGVETPEQKQILQELGCDFLQGYLFSPPLPPHAFEQLLKQG